MCPQYRTDDPASQPQNIAAARAALELAEQSGRAFQPAFEQARRRYQDLVRAPIISRPLDRPLVHNIGVALDLARAALDLDIDLLSEVERVNAYAEIERLEMDLDLAEDRRDTPPVKPPTAKERWRQQVWAMHAAKRHWEDLLSQVGATYETDYFGNRLKSEPQYTVTDPAKLAEIEAARIEYEHLDGLIECPDKRPLNSQGYPISNAGPRRAIVNGYVKTRRTVKIDGVRVPVVEYV